jgi:hypothetical protein
MASDSDMDSVVIDSTKDFVATAEDLMVDSTADAVVVFMVDILADMDTDDKILNPEAKSLEADNIRNLQEVIDFLQAEKSSAFWNPRRVKVIEQWITTLNELLPSDS